VILFQRKGRGEELFPVLQRKVSLAILLEEKEEEIELSLQSKEKKGESTFPRKKGSPKRDEHEAVSLCAKAEEGRLKPTNVVGKEREEVSSSPISNVEKRKHLLLLRGKEIGHLERQMGKREEGGGGKNVAYYPVAKEQGSRDRVPKKKKGAVGSDGIRRKKGEGARPVEGV